MNDNHITAEMISTPEERAAWIAELKAQAEAGREAEKELRQRPLSASAGYGANVDWGHQLDQAMGRYEQAELAIQYLTGAPVSLDDLWTLDSYVGCDIFETLESRAGESAKAR